jgi:hypothetical protein
MWGASAFTYLAYNRGPLSLPFLPALWVFSLFGYDSPFGDIPAWLEYAFAVVAEFAGVLLVVHIIRLPWQIVVAIGLSNRRIARQSSKGKRSAT